MLTKHIATAPFVPVPRSLTDREVLSPWSGQGKDPRGTESRTTTSLPSRPEGRVTPRCPFVSDGSAEMSSVPRDQAVLGRRYQQLRHAEERLRPLRGTRLAKVYWQVHDEFHRLGRELAKPERRWM
ncbi:hypothetical protein ACYOEI_33395 [Singulisphaera rosea]